MILAVETSGPFGSVALLSGSQVLSQQTWQREGSHSEFITVALKRLLEIQKMPLSQIKMIAVGTGPGSFTGIRVAVNFARALAYALQVPVFALNSLALIASQPSLRQYNGTVAILRYGFRDIFYGAQYHLSFGAAGFACRESEAPVAMPATAIPGWIPAKSRVICDRIDVLKVLLPGTIVASIDFDTQSKAQSEAGFFSGTLVARDAHPPVTDWIHTIPLYIRASEAEEKLRASNVGTAPRK